MNEVLVIAGVALAGGALGAGFGRGASAAARFAQWAVALAFGVGVLLRPAVVWHERAVAARSVPLPAGASDTEVLVAAAHAPPAATALQLQWHGGASPPAAATFGASVHTPRPLPFAPEAMQVRLLGRPAVGRPFALEVVAPTLAVPLPARVSVRSPAAELAAFDVQLGGGTKVESVLPTAVGPLTVTVHAEDGERELLFCGTFGVDAPAALLVLEPSGLAAAALQAQGVPSVAAVELPADLRPFPAIVLGTSLPEAEQLRLAQAVQDGLGLFVVGAGVPAPGAPLHELLPLRVLPSRPDPAGPDVAPGPGSPGDTPAPDVTPPSPHKAPDAGAVPPSTPVGDEPIEVDKHSIAMVLVVDRSGSMGAMLADGRSKMSYAKSSALRTAQTLGAGDQVAIVTFGTKNEGRVELPLTDATATAAVRAGCERLAHQNEMTYLLSGLQKAYELVQTSPAAVKHVVVVSDGEFDRNEGIALGALANKMREQARTTLSVISIVDSLTNPTWKAMAERLARDGGGQFVTVSEPGSIPAFVAAEVTRSLERAGRTPQPDGGAPPRDAAEDTQKKPPEPKPPEPKPPEPRREPERTRRIAVRAVAESALLSPLPAAEWPTLAQAQAGAARLDAQVLLVAGDDGWPLLAFGNRGLGRVGAFAADLFGADAAEFRAEAAFPARLAAWLQSLRPGVADPVAVVPMQFAASVAAPTPDEHAAWLAFAGVAAASASTPVAVAVPGAPTLLRSTPVAAVAGLLVAVLVALVAMERWLAARARRSGIA